MQENQILMNKRRLESQSSDQNLKKEDTFVRNEQEDDRRDKKKNTDENSKLKTCKDEVFYLKISLCKMLFLIH